MPELKRQTLTCTQNLRLAWRFGQMDRNWEQWHVQTGDVGAYGIT